MLFAFFLFLLPQAPPPPQAPPAVEVWPTWKQVSHKALHEKRAVIVFSGCPPRHVANEVVCCEMSFADTQGPAIVVGIPDGDWFSRHDLPANASDEQIMETVRLKAVAAAPAPVQPPFTVKTFRQMATVSAQNC